MFAMFALPVDLIRDVLQSWLDMKSLSRLDIATCNRNVRPLFMAAVAETERKVIFKTAWPIETDLMFPWFVSRNINLPMLHVHKLSTDPVQMSPYKNSMTALSIKYLAFHPKMSRQQQINPEWFTGMATICLNVQCVSRLNLVNNLNLQEHHALQSLHLYQLENVAVDLLYLPTQLQSISLTGHVSSYVLNRVLDSCPALQQLDVRPFRNFPALIDFSDLFTLEIVGKLPITLTSLDIAPQFPTTGIEVLVVRCRALKTLKLGVNHDFTQTAFDLIFQLPSLQEINMEGLNVRDVHGLAAHITCLSLQQITLFGFEGITHAEMVSLVSRCSAKCKARVTDMSLFTVQYGEGGENDEN